MGLQRQAAPLKTPLARFDARPRKGFASAWSRRQRQLRRYQGEKIYCNAQMSSRQIARYCNISADCEKLLENAMSRLGLSARAHNRVLKVSRTVADLAGAESISTDHISEAIQYRSLGRNYWA